MSQQAIEPRRRAAGDGSGPESASNAREATYELLRALRLTFSDGLSGKVDVLDRMRGPVFEEARTPRGSRA